MSELINFVRHRRKLLSQKQKNDYRYFRITSIALGIIFAVFIATLGVRLFLAYSINQLDSERKTLLQRIIGQEENERSFVVFTSKLRTLVELFSERRNKQEAIAFFTNAFDDRVLVSDMSYNAKESLLSFGLVSDDVFTLEEVFATLQGPEVKQTFQKITLSQLKRQTDGRYNLVVTVVLKGAGSERTAPAAAEEAIP